jgi:4-amino-4-deoxy-L-arabinose transferase-like glycosyltransferase
VSRGERAGLALALLVFLALCADTARRTSATFDEIAHVGAAYTHLAFGDYRLTPEHPPLVKNWIALPLVGGGAQFKADDDAYRMRRPWELGKRFLYRWNDADTLLWRARMMNALLGAALIAATALFARRLGGPVAFWCALPLCALHPDFLAHAPLVTTDIGAALWVLLAVMAAERLRGGLGAEELRLRRSPHGTGGGLCPAPEPDGITPARVAALGLGAGAALATKMSALVLLPVLALLALALWRAGAAPRRLAAAALATTLVAGLALWTAYGFRTTIARDAQVEAAIDWQKHVRQAPAISAPVLALRATGLLPEAWLYGFLRFYTTSGDVPAFLLGLRRDGGFPHYFLVTFGLKTPLPLLALLAAAAALAATKRLELVRGAAPFLLVPVVVFGTLTLTRGIHIGHRHLLPIYPFLLVLAALAAAALWRRGAPARLALVALLVARAADEAALHPHHLAFFNAVAGGPARGWEALVDSNVDWGQDLKALVAWQREAQVPRLKLSYFGTADAEYHGLAADFLPGYQLPRPRETTWSVSRGDVVVVSATNLQKVYVPTAAWPLMDRLRALTPRARVGYSLFVYDADFDWQAEPPVAGETEP